MKNLSISQNFSDKQQEVDINNLRVADDEGQSQSKNRLGSGKAAAGAPLSQIPGVKKSVGHTNSLSGTTLPKYGVDPKTNHEAELAKVRKNWRKRGSNLYKILHSPQILENSEKWGVDMFKIAEITEKKTLTCITYTIFQASLTNKNF